jgi:hypothetical protein
MIIISHLLFKNEYTSFRVGASAKVVSPQSFPAPDIHDIVRHIFMGTEINNNNGVNCYRATAVFLPLAYENNVPSQHL